eukprot:7018663-Ditylum_brightwellii.AAC.1
MTLQREGSADLSVVLDESALLPEPAGTALGNGNIMDQDIRVCVQIQPLSTKEIIENSKEAVSVDQYT